MPEMAAGLICEAVTILTGAGIMDYNGHASIRDELGGFLINSGASDRAAMTLDQVCRIDPAGEGIEGDRPPNEVQLHAAIYACRADIKAIVHAHPKWTTLFSLTGTPIPVVLPQGCLVADLPVYPEAHSISTPERGARVAEILSAQDGVLLAGHGSVLTGATLQQAVAYAIYAEQNAERAYLARALGTPRAIAPSEYEAYRQTLAKPGLYQKCWAYYLSQRRFADVR